MLTANLIRKILTFTQIRLNICQLKDLKIGNTQECIDTGKIIAETAPRWI